MLMPLQVHEADHRSSPSALPLLLVEEFSHRVVNEYAQAVASLRITARRTCSEEARSAMEEAAVRLCGYAEVHRALQVPRAIQTVDLTSYLEGLCKAVSASTLQDRGIILSLAGDSAIMSAERAWRVALMVSELITNAARHGVNDGGGAILIRLEDLGDVVSCHVIDNGGVTMRPVASRGLSVVRRLAEEIGGDARWTFGEQGTRVELTIPFTQKDGSCA
jgi:two-component sensor histidine kinase